MLKIKLERYKKMIHNFFFFSAGKKIKTKTVSGNVMDRHGDFLLINDQHILCNNKILLRLKYFT